jgi:hypothetical protein
MNPVNKMKALKGAVAFAAILAMSGSAIAKKNNNGGGIPADLSDDRTTVTLSVTPQCQQSSTVGATVSADYSVYIFQSVGRLINIGIASGEGLPCNSTTPIDIIVEAVDGLTFQPGPATMILKFTTIESTTPVGGTPTETQVGIPIESGARINLH